MRNPLPLAARGEGEAEYLVNVLANLFYVCGIDNEPDVTKTEATLLDLKAPYRKAGELLAPLYILREGDFDLHAISTQDIGTRFANWLGEEVFNMMGSHFVEIPRLPSAADVEAYVHAGWAVVATVGQRYGQEQIVCASPVLIVGAHQPIIYNPVGKGEPHPYSSVLFGPHQDVHAGIFAVKPR